MAENDVDKEESKVAGEISEDKVNLDTILVNEIGQFGIYQLKILILSAILVIFAAWAASEYIFTTARIESRCYIWECDPADEPAQFRPPWLLHAVPGTSDTDFDNCQRYGNTTAPRVDTCPAALFDTSTRYS